MGTDDKGLRALLPGVVLPSEEKEIQEAREYIKRKVGPISELRAAPSLSTDDVSFLSSNLHKAIIEKLPAEKKDEYGFTPSQNKEIEAYLTRPTDPNAKGSWDRFVKFNEEEDKRAEKLKVSNQPILNNNINGKLTPAERRKNLYNKKYDLPKQYDVKKDKVTVDPKHPDGFRLTEDEDLYRHYGDIPVRYIQEIMYKYENDAPAPTETVKKFNGYDKSSYPSDPTQKKLLSKYENIYNKLNPVQKRQLVAIQRKK